MYNRLSRRLPSKLGTISAGKRNIGRIFTGFGEGKSRKYIMDCIGRDCIVAEKLEPPQYRE